MTERESTLESKISEWLQNQGYPLEMRVASVFRETGFLVSQSEYYVDPDSEESREIDVIAYDSKFIKSKTVRITFVIECKASRDKPWVLFTSAARRIPSRSRVVQRAASKLGTRLLRHISDSEEIQDLKIFQLPASPAYGMTQAFTSGNDICYSAVMSVAKASLASISKADQVPKALSILGRFGTFEIVFPVIVTEARLFEACLSESSTLEVSEVLQGALLWRNPILGKRFTIVNVMNTTFLQEFCQNAKVAADAIFSRSDEETLQHLMGEKSNHPE